MNNNYNYRLVVSVTNFKFKEIGKYAVQFFK